MSTDHVKWEKVISSMQKHDMVLCGIYIYILYIYWVNNGESLIGIDILVGGIPTPLKNMSSSVGIMKFSTEWNNKTYVPTHQPDMVSCGKANN